jgi:periplasmic protein TonB
MRAAAAQPGSATQRAPVLPRVAELPPELALALGRHFRYPWAARRLGLEGEVRVRFAVDGGGAVAPSGLVRSSGHNLLDHAALAGLAQLARAEHLPDLGGRTVELPVRYRLER